jgi:DNA-binding response OmpR family regulator
MQFGMGGLIEDDPKAPRYLQTVRGEGYMLQPD